MLTLDQYVAAVDTAILALLVGWVVDHGSVQHLLPQQALARADYMMLPEQKSERRILLDA